MKTYISLTDAALIGHPIAAQIDGEWGWITSEPRLISTKKALRFLWEGTNHVAHIGRIDDDHYGVIIVVNDTKIIHLYSSEDAAKQYYDEYIGNFILDSRTRFY